MYLRHLPIRVTRPAVVQRGQTSDLIHTTKRTGNTPRAPHPVSFAFVTYSQCGTRSFRTLVSRSGPAFDLPRNKDIDMGCSSATNVQLNHELVSGRSEHIQPGPGM